MTDDGIQEVLDAVGALAAELTEIRKDVKTAISYGVDVERLTADVVRIDATLMEIHAFMTGPPALTERLARLEVKQEREHQEDKTGVKGAGTADDSEHRASSRAQAGELVTASEARQSEINVEFRAGLSRVERALFDILHASLKTKATVGLILGVVIFILARALAG